MSPSGWKIKPRKRPESESTAREFYSAEEAERYAQSSGMRREQQKLVVRAIELAGVREGERVLDAGCGTGFGLDVLLKLGCRAAGVDSSPAMVEKALALGLDARVADVRSLPFPDASFDALISISVVQWLLQGPEKKWEDDVKRAAREFNRVLVPGGRAVIQFYPESQAQALAVGKRFVRAGFAGTLVEDSPESPRKRKVFLVLAKR